MNREHKIFLNTLNLEYEAYKKMSFSDFNNLEIFLKSENTKKNYNFSLNYNEFLTYCYNHYCNILDKCINCSSKDELKKLRGEAHITSIYIYQDPFSRMYWVVQDALYYGNL